MLPEVLRATIRLDGLFVLTWFRVGCVATENSLEVRGPEAENVEVVSTASVLADLRLKALDIGRLRNNHTPWFLLRYRSMWNS